MGARERRGGPGLISGKSNWPEPRIGASKNSSKTVHGKVIGPSSGSSKGVSRKGRGR